MPESPGKESSVGIGEIVNAAKDALAPVAHTLGDVWQRLLGNQIAAWRIKNAARLQVAVNAEASRLGLKLDHSKVPERYAITWFEEATKQDEDEIQILFARLLAKASSGQADASDRRHIETVSRLTPTDASVVQYLFESKFGSSKVKIGESILPKWSQFILIRDLNNKFGIDGVLSLEHCISLGIFIRSFNLTQKEIRSLSGSDRVNYRIENEICGTALGLSMWSAIRPD